MSRLNDTIQRDYLSAKQELTQVEERRKQLIWQLQYIEKLLGSTGAPEGEGQAEAGRFAGMTIADIAAYVLRENGKPMSAMDIAKRAMAGGFDAENVERARSHFSAVISKDINSAKPRFWQVDRGAIGLVEWQQGDPAATPKAIVGFKDEDIPF